ncbi:hypothetical protein Cylst_5738 [Cylindrospermum stagnale PCC 7417]|uniref:DUF309 domain-containing protein n=1 Tax=Cylindrospermum stagnale PCC 7417 TaxID=56107 RepID=K9X6L2_9NOST|nr:DUF309 domain-containing protein [Cylindrospermum stagnale]AFZ27734.1 hypothetical protein Cylst_5738 [Cylindrospermum stagnale PCC 7417]
MSEIMPQEFWQGVEQFNSGQFYACHDTLEALWIEATEPDKSFYQGILQIAVALYHLGNGNWRGAVILLGEGTNRLRRYPAIYGSIDVEEFLNQSWALLAILQKTGPDKIAAGDFGENETLSLPRISLVDNLESGLGNGEIVS